MGSGVGSWVANDTFLEDVLISIFQGLRTIMQMSLMVHGFAISVGGLMLIHIQMLRTEGTIRSIVEK